jgi:FAD synthase
VAGHKIGLQTFFLQHAPCRYRRRQYRRLGYLGQLQFLFRTFATKLRQLDPERFVGLLKSLARDGVVVGQLFAHTNALRALAGKKKSNR